MVITNCFLPLGSQLILLHYYAPDNSALWTYGRWTPSRVGPEVQSFLYYVTIRVCTSYYYRKHFTPLRIGNGKEKKNLRLFGGRPRPPT